MVKINLMGSEAEEERRPEIEPEVAPEGGEESFTGEPPEAEVEPEELVVPSKPNWLPVTLAAVILVAVVVAFWILWPRRQAGVPAGGEGEVQVTEGVEQPTQPPAEEVSPEAPGAAEEAEAEAKPAEPVSAGIPTTPATPAIATSVLAPTAASVSQVTRVLDVGLGPASLGLLSQTDGEMVVEILGKTAADLKAGREAYLSAFPGAQVKLTTEDTREIEGEVFRRTILTVEVPVAGGEAPAEARYLDVATLKSELRQLARRHDLAVRSLDVSRQVEEEQFVKTPVRFKALGSKEAIANFLRAMADAAWNVRVTKILLVPADWHRMVRDRLLTLVIEMDLCEPL